MATSLDLWTAAEEACRTGLTRDADFDVARCLFRHRVGWTEAIKSIRKLTGCSLHDALLRALANDDWRRWCRRQVATNTACAREAASFARQHPTNPFIALEGRKPVFVERCRGEAPSSSLFPG